MSSYNSSKIRTTHSTQSWWSIDEPTALIWILALAAIVIGAGLGLRDPWPADEPRFAQIAREMVMSGDWLFPTRGGELYSDKPPVFMWLIAAFYALLGNLRIAFLLPSAIASLATLALLHDLTRRLWTPRIANVAALLLLGSLQFVLQGKTAQIDALVAFWIMLGVYGLLRHLIDGPAFNCYLIGWFAMGMGIITKGVGFLPILLLVPYAALALTHGHQNVIKPHITMLVGPVIMLSTVALWLIPVLLTISADGDPKLLAYRDDILFRQTAERYTDSWGHLKPWYYLIVSVIPIFWLPVSLALPYLIKPWYRAFVAYDARIVLPLVWIVLFIAFFSASPGKRGVYILPALPMLGLVAAPFIEDLLFKQGSRIAVSLILGILAIVGISIGLAGIAGLDSLANLEGLKGVSPWSLVLSIGVCAAIGCALAIRRSVALGWFAFVIPVWVLYSTLGYTLTNPIRTPAPIYRALLEQTGPDIQLGLLQFRAQWLLFAPVPITHFGFATSDVDQEREAWRWLDEAAKGSSPRYILLSDRNKRECYVQGAGIYLGSAHRQEWILIGVEDRLDTCPLPETVVPRFNYDQPGAL